MNIGGRVESVRFNVVPLLAVDVIIGCDFFDTHIEPIRPRKCIVELNDGTAVPIVGRTDKRPTGSIPLPEEQVYIPAARRPPNMVRIEEEINLAPEPLIWVKAKTQTQGLITIEPYAPLYNKN